MAPPRVLVVSDLHLGLGRDPVTGAFAHRENFVVDEPFANWLAHEGGAGTLLVLNGDTFDFLRVNAVPRTEEDLRGWSARLAGLGAPRDVEALRGAVQEKERRYGLRTDDYKSVFKLDRMGQGHPAFFAALAAHVAAGGELLVMVGNHDLELHWPLVQAHVRALVVEGGAPAERVAAAVAFEPDSVRLDNLHVEHGHRWEPMTAVEGPVTLPEDPSQLNLPMGSFVNRYFINRVEALDPFIDNVKPVERSLVRLARQRPLAILRTYGGGWSFVARVVSKRRPTGPAAAILALLLVPPLVVALVAALIVNEVSVLPNVVPAVPGAVLVVAALLVLAVVVVNRLRRRGRHPHDLVGATTIAAAEADGWPRSYVCMGHTHVPGLYRLDPDGRRMYVNTGTWIALWPETRPDLVGRTVLTYARFDAVGEQGYAHRLLEWDDRAGRPRAAVVFAPEED